MKNQLKEILEGRKKNKSIGIPSYCTASDIVIKALLVNAKKTNTPVLIEATANQVNQYGGYTGMLPADFVQFVYNIADEVKCDKSLVFLAGDHLGPLTWKNLDEAEAMEKSKVLVYEYVKAGFTKIHLDTSMKLGSDDPNSALETKVIAQRGAILYKECMRAFKEIDDGTKTTPVYVIGSEVPIPGGAQEAEDSISVTTVSNFSDTVNTYKEVFSSYGIEDAFENIIAVVVQPGVEFGDSQVFLYNREEAKELSKCIEAYDGLVFEGHSTDYQTKNHLRELVEDNFAILKVGPALTFRLREALFMLSYIEKAIIPKANWANFIETLEDSMVEHPENWENHYHGTEQECAIARKYSYSDRSRYYFTNEKVKKAIETLIYNLETTQIPMNVLHQYMPSQYQKIMYGTLANNVHELLHDSIMEIVSDYEYACKPLI